MVATSFKPPADVFGVPPTLIGSALQPQNYTEALGYMPFFKFMGNGLRVAALGTILNMAVSALPATRSRGCAGAGGIWRSWFSWRPS